jgi:hypothetical protein
VSEYRTKMTTDRVSQGRTLQMLFESLAAHGDATAVLALRDGAVRRWSHGELDDTFSSRPTAPNGSSRASP